MKYDDYEIYEVTHDWFRLLVVAKDDKLYSGAMAGVSDKFTKHSLDCVNRIRSLLHHKGHQFKPLEANALVGASITKFKEDK